MCRNKAMSLQKGFLHTFSTTVATTTDTTSSTSQTLCRSTTINNSTNTLTIHHSTYTIVTVTNEVGQLRPQILHLSLIQPGFLFQQPNSCRLSKAFENKGRYNTIRQRRPEANITYKCPSLRKKEANNACHNDTKH